MRICFYSPYVPDHFGGGEKHFFDVARTARTFHTIFIGVSDSSRGRESLESIKKRYQLFLNDALQDIEFVSTPLGGSGGMIKKLLWTKSYDAIYYVTDGSLFFSHAKHNYLHIQIPFTDTKISPIDRLKLWNWGHKNTNSEFTKSIIQKHWHTNIDSVINPMVDVDEFSNERNKKKIILSVGRFFQHLHSKRQDVLVEIFKKMSEQHADLLKGWKLVLAGSVEDHAYLKKVKNAARGYPIEFATDISRVELKKLYEKASIYWHATGFEIDEEVHPQKVEHFGITTVEAMAAGVIPLVNFKGGQKEVLGNDLKNLGWVTEEECIKKTCSFLESDVKISDYQEKVLQRAQHFSKQKFDKKIEELFSV